MKGLTTREICPTSLELWSVPVATHSTSMEKKAGGGRTGGGTPIGLRYISTNWLNSGV